METIKTDVSNVSDKELWENAKAGKYGDNPQHFVEQCESYEGLMEGWKEEAREFIGQVRNHPSFVRKGNDFIKTIQNVSKQEMIDGLREAVAEGREIHLMPNDMQSYKQKIVIF